jgi:hypothetical protein
VVVEVAAMFEVFIQVIGIIGEGRDLHSFAGAVLLDMRR